MAVMGSGLGIDLGVTRPAGGKFHPISFYFTSRLFFLRGCEGGLKL
jgi:hypothetical protein